MVGQCVPNALQMDALNLLDWSVCANSFSAHPKSITARTKSDQVVAVRLNSPHSPNYRDALFQ